MGYLTWHLPDELSHWGVLPIGTFPECCNPLVTLDDGQCNFTGEREREGGGGGGGGGGGVLELRHFTYNGSSFPQPTVGLWPCGKCITYIVLAKYNQAVNKTSVTMHV